MHPNVLPRQILFGKKFKTPLYKIGKLVMKYNVTANNKAACPRALYALYIGPNDSGIGPIIFELSTKKLVTTSKYKPKPITEDIVTIVNKIAKRNKGMSDGINFQNMHHE